MSKKVTVYSTPGCSFCSMAKDFFREKGVEFEDFNVAEDLEKRKEMLEKSGQMGVPVIVIGEEMVVGFNKPVIMQMLEIKE
ncbi:MAG: Uxx-star family glutaredoxin-like (seleno)protein [Patescibacteria group bacterium]|nr:Uxx-star family glutaredoxin-like (seleno)protein [Patescibacteria group bacterium]